METSTGDLLAGAAKRGDALADRVIASFVREVRPDDLLEYLRNVIRLPGRLHLDHQLETLGESMSAREAFRRFLAEMSVPPAWIQPDLVETGAAFFRERVSAAAIALGTASLPTCYCWSPEAHVLMFTQRLATDTPRRILETAQFVLDVMSPKGLVLGVQPFSRGVQAVQKVRLMHAVVRFMLRHKQDLYQQALARYQCKTKEELVAVGRTRNPWVGFLVSEDTEGGGDLAINQEQLAGTMLTFSVVILQAFRNIRMRVSEEEVEAYLHAWNVVGYLMGVEEELLTRSAREESAEDLRLAIMQRHRRPTANAKELTSSLSKYLAEDIELILRLHRWLPAERIPRLTMWMLLESETRDANGVALDAKDKGLYWLVRFIALLVGLLHNLPGIGRLSTYLFDYLSRKAWAWRNVPFSQPFAEPPTLAVATERALRNWSDTVETLPARVAHPGSTAEIAEILTDTAAYPSPVRVMGAFHSTTPCASADGGTLIRLDRLRRVLDIGPDYVEAEAGALYMDVAHELWRRGLEFFINLQVGNITMGAAACSTTKDGAFPTELAQASSYCTAMTLVLPNGSIRRIDDSTPGGLMQVARCSHGLLGVICTVRFRVRPTVPFSIEHRNMSTEEFLRALPALQAQDCSLEYYLYPFIDRVTVQIRRKTQPAGDVDRCVWRLRNFSVSRIVPRAARFITALPGAWLRNSLSNLFYRVSSRGLAWLCRADETYAVDQMTRYLDPPGKYGFTFGLWGFAENAFPQILREYIALLKSHAEETGYRSHLLTVGYVVSQDAQALLSYSSDSRVITIDPTGFGGAEWDRFIDVYNDFCSRRGGIPLFNQTPGLNAGQVQRAFGERLRKFEQTRRACDPGNRLLNPYFAALLQGAGS